MDFGLFMNHQTSLVGLQGIPKQIPLGTLSAKRESCCVYLSGGNGGPVFMIADQKVVSSNQKPVTFSLQTDFIPILDVPFPLERKKKDNYVFKIKGTCNI